MNKTFVSLGNQSFRDHDYQAAIQYYRNAIAAYPQLKKMLQTNIDLAQKRLAAISKESHKVTTTAVDIVVPVYNALRDVQDCLTSLNKHRDGYNIRLIIVNDGSGLPTTQWLREFTEQRPDVLLIEHPQNLGYTRAVNSGLKATSAPYVILQNSDTIVTAGWLRGLIRCMESSPNIGIVGPLSNAASWQNVPILKDESGNFAINEAPCGLDVEGMAKLISSVSMRSYPRVPFVNGFCFMIRRVVIDAIGYMDEKNFPIGYGEENDYCIRAMEAGFELVIADDVYVYHSKSKSFGHEQRKSLSAQGNESLRRKHGAKVNTYVNEIKNNRLLDAVRTRVIAALKTINDNDYSALLAMRILFLLPVKGGGGGSHSVVQEVAEMRRLGVQANVGVRSEDLGCYLKMYTSINNSADIFVGFHEHTLLQLAEKYDVVVGTIFHSMLLVKRVIDAYPHILPAYYVQDYEPLFFETGTSKWRGAYDSYTLIPDAFLFAKTRWIIDEVMKHHAVNVHKVQPSIDHSVYKPLPRSSNDGRLCVTAMIRPQTPQRGADRTMRLLKRLYEKHNGHLDIHIFGCDGNDPAFASLPQGFPFNNHGVLLREQVASLLANSDLFIDLSDYQAFGRTALEAMACGCVSVVPKAGGADEYAVHNKNSLVADTHDEDACFVAVSQLLASPQKLQDMRRAGLETAARYSVHAAAVSELLPLEARWREWRLAHPRVPKPIVVLIPGLRSDALPLGSAYVRLLLPYQSPAVLKYWQVKTAPELPEPGSAECAVIHRQAIGLTLSKLESWHQQWKAAGGKLIYDIDDDLLDADGLLARGYKSDLGDTFRKVEFLVKCADVVHASTEKLALLLREHNSCVRVVPNLLDPDLWALGQERRHDEGPYRRGPDVPIRIGYIGTPTHDEDLEIVTEAMRSLENKYGRAVEIEVIGAFQNIKPKFGKRVGLPKKNDYPNFVRWLLQRVHWDIGIIPLAKSRFNASKSYLKFLEYAALDMAIVVSDVDAYRPVARHMVNCLIVEDGTKNWLNAIEELIAQPDLRSRLASRARSDVVQHTTKQFHLVV